MACHSAGMRNEQLVSATAEQIIRDASDRILTPAEGECLACFVDRQLAEFQCDGTRRFIKGYRATRAPRATALLRKLADRGACCCDCELLMNAYQPHRRLWTRPHRYDVDGIGFDAPAEPPAKMPPCAGVRRGSTQPCDNWTAIPRMSYPW